MPVQAGEPFAMPPLSSSAMTCCFYGKARLANKCSDQGKGNAYAITLQIPE
jgi:hypothetical protein